MVDPARQPLPDAIFDEAARWLADGFDGALSPEKVAERDTWLAADERHARAYEEMQQVWAHLDGVPETQSLRNSVPPPSRGRRRHSQREWQRRGGRRVRARWAMPAIAASLALIVGGVVGDWPTRLQADAMTATGERRIVALPDGSAIHLDTQSAVAIDYSGDRRLVRLLKGEALFSVTPDPARPFSVVAGNGSTTALGTKFLVAREGDDTRIVVTEHRVRVAYPTLDSHTAFVVEGHALTYGPEKGLRPVIPIDGADATAWTNGMLVFKDTPLVDVVTAIGRYHPGYVQVLGNARTLRVSGVFRIDNPVVALDQLQRSLDLRSTHLTDRLIFIFSRSKIFSNPDLSFEEAQAS